MNGGDWVAEVLKAHCTPFLFTLCGGHISPILVACKKRGIRVIDTRHEATAVFAADAVARLTGKPSVVAVTAGPGLTNCTTAIRNAYIAQSPVVLIGGAAPTARRGALQDIDQMAVIRPHVKWAVQVRRVKDLIPALEKGCRIASEGVPGPIFVETPVDVLYDEALVRHWYGVDRDSKTLAGKALKAYLRFHLNRMFAQPADPQAWLHSLHVRARDPDPARVRQAADALRRARRPVIVVGSQAMLDPQQVQPLIAALDRIGAPVYLSGMARGLLGRDHALQLRHQRREALREADCVFLAGLPADFRLDYGHHIPRRAAYISANRSREIMNQNRRPTIGILGDPALAVQGIARMMPSSGATAGAEWLRQLHDRDTAHGDELAEQAHEPVATVNPVYLCQEIDEAVTPKAILIGDGGDFVATAASIMRPPGPLRWLDPGAFGTLGIGAGFALGAKLVHPDAEVWVLFGDGAVGYSLSEFDSLVRHTLPVIAVVGNDAAWSQVARGQIEMFHDDVGTALSYTDYHCVAEGFGAAGLRVADPELISETIDLRVHCRRWKAGPRECYSWESRFSKGRDLDGPV